MPSTSLKAEQTTQRDLDIFENLYFHQVMSTDQISVSLCSSMVNLVALRSRLRKLVRGGFINVIRTASDEPNVFVLGQGGMNELSDQRHFLWRRIRTSRSTRTLLDHDKAVTDFTLTMQFSARDNHEPAAVIYERSILERSDNEKMQQHRGWQASFHHPDYGSQHNFWVKPDRLFGFRFSHRPANRNERYYVAEIDRGTMDYVADFTQPSILRKLLAYEATIANGLLKEHFNIPHPYMLFIGKTEARRDRSVELAMKHVVNDDAAKAMLFAAQPPSPSFAGYTHVSDMEWINGLGVRVQYPI